MTPPPLPRELWECVHDACIKSIDRVYRAKNQRDARFKVKWSFCGKCMHLRESFLHDVKVICTLDLVSAGTRVPATAWHRIFELRRSALLVSDPTCRLACLL